MWIYICVFPLAQNITLELYVISYFKRRGSAIWWACVFNFFILSTCCGCNIELCGEVVCCFGADARRAGVQRAGQDHVWIRSQGALQAELWRPALQVLSAGETHAGYNHYWFAYWDTNNDRILRQKSLLSNILSSEIKYFLLRNTRYCYCILKVRSAVPWRYIYDALKTDLWDKIDSKKWQLFLKKT